MSAADIAINIAAQFTGKTAFDKAEDSAAKLQKSVKTLGKSLGLALGATAIASYGKAAVRAFAQDDNAARSLAKTLENLGLNTRYAGSTLNGYISTLEKQTGVLDDELRPAMDRLLRATGSITKSQELLSLALDISAGTGKDLTTVSQGLQKAYLGNNASLGRLGVGLTKAELKSSSFMDIQDKLTMLFAGQAQDAANSYQGSLNKLTIASNNAKEAIGKGLIDALGILSGSSTVDPTVSAIDKIANKIADMTRGVARFIRVWKEMLTGFDLFIPEGGYGNTKIFSQGMSIAGQTENAAAKKQRLAMEKQNKILDTGNKLKTIDNNATARKIVLTGDQLALQELEKKFDVERIGLYSALNQSTDGETQMRLLSLIAIKDQNAALAGMIQKATQTTDALQTFRQAIIDAIKALINMVNAQLLQLQQQFPTTTVTGGGGGVSSNYDLNAVSGGMPGAIAESFGSTGAGSVAGWRAKEGFVTTINYNINAQGIGDQQIASVVQGAIQDLNRYGSSTTYAGAI